MLIPIKIFTVDRGIPSKDDLIEAKQICIEEGCSAELRWLPNTWAGWYHLYIDKNTDIDYAYEHQVPKVYGV
jgi:hypothetical protein